MPFNTELSSRELSEEGKWTNAQKCVHRNVSFSNLEKFKLTSISDKGWLINEQEQSVY